MEIKEFNKIEFVLISVFSDNELFACGENSLLFFLKQNLPAEKKAPWSKSKKTLPAEGAGTTFHTLDIRKSWDSEQILSEVSGITCRMIPSGLKLYSI